MKSPLFVVLSTLWKMLSPARRVRFGGHIALLFVSGLFDMTSVLFIFGFIGGLSVDPTTGEREGKLGVILKHLSLHPLSQEAYVLWVGIAVVALLLVKNILATIVQFSLTRFLMKLNENACEQLLRGFMVTPLERLSSKGAARAGKDIATVFDVFSTCFSAVAQILVDGTTLAMVALVLLWISPAMTLGAAAWFGLGGVGIYALVQKRLVAMASDQRGAKKKAGRYLNDGLFGLIDVRLRDAREKIAIEYSKALRRVSLFYRRMQAMERAPRSTNEILLATLLIGAVAGFTFIGDNLETAMPVLGIFAFAGVRMTGAMSRVNKSFQRLKRQTQNFTDAYHSVLESAPQLLSSKIAPQHNYLADERKLPPDNDGKLHRALIARNVTFRYAKNFKPAVDNVSVEVKKGTMISFCGPSGGGKSTIIMLLLGLIRPETGEITCDDWNIFHHIRAWHSNIGFVGQEMYIPERTLAENVAFGLERNEIDSDRVWQALKMASADKFVRKLPKKLAYRVRAGGANLSGGQRQRILLARALYHNPDVLILDEATSALDTITEREVTEAIGALNGEKTVICIAHRLSTIRRSDRIYLVIGGRIAAEGTYEELLETSEDFRNLAEENRDPGHRTSTTTADENPAHDGI